MKKKLFIIITILFILTMVFITYQMSRQTTAPWEKKKDLLDKYKVK